MKLKSFAESECQAYYRSALAYRIIKYVNHADNNYKAFFSKKYQNALKVQQRDHVYIAYSTNQNELYNKLKETLSEVSKMEQDNRTTIDDYGHIIEDLILSTIPVGMNEYEKIVYLSEYIAANVTYSGCWFDYCANTPPGDGIDFDFKKGVPVDTSINGMLVIGQGTCDDISNLIYYLGSKLGLKIEKIFTNYRGFFYSFNAITFKDGKRSYIDLTRIIRGDKTIDECFLVSASDLNIKNDYIKDDYHDDVFTIKGEPDILPTTTIPAQEVDMAINNVCYYVSDLNQMIDALKANDYDEIFDKNVESVKIR